MFDIGLPEFAVLAVAALFIFGPERLPQAAAQAAKMLKQIRNMANNARSELTNELGPEFGNLKLRRPQPAHVHPQESPRGHRARHTQGRHRDHEVRRVRRARGARARPARVLDAPADRPRRNLSPLS